ncbi:hypothetical protein EVAR_73735_1 [Eumeta japonica]|uniref:Uncharacterized protein n=1 Tax=Eumeta variegata TaxID=151549 RepID=A0A4C1T4Q2_EUMVA|nr:hypothetical protein EVAR_73735_1 [Eumeta japonica]
MGVVASSAALLGFEDEYAKQETQQHNELQRNFSLSTIQEEHTSQLYETPQGDITMTDKGDVSFSFDGKEVSVSLYETPDLTEEEALKIVEMYADQISEHVTEHNIVELPPLRFVKETSQSGKLLMEAVVIDISPEYFSHEEDLRTEAGMDDISINEITIHGSSLKDEEELDKQTEDFARSSFEKWRKSYHRRHHKKAQKSKRIFKTTETEAQLQDISGAVGDGLKVVSDKRLKIVSNEIEIEKNIKSLPPLAKLLNILDSHLTAVESEVVNQSALLMTPASADQSIAIIKNIIDPLSQIQSKLKVYSGETPLDTLFETMSEDVHKLHVALQVIEKCVEIDETGTTLIQRTSVCIIDSLADHLIKALQELRTISESFENESLKSHLQLTVDDIKQGLEITKDTIKSQVLLQEAQEIEVTEHFTETMAKLQEAALEKVENELTLEETDDDIYKKVMDKDIDKYNLSVLENIKKPIDELNYCIRQIEQKSIAGSITDLVDPLQSLNDKIRISQDILKLSTIQKSSDVTDTLEKMYNLIKTIEIDIEENELKNIQKENALDEEQAQKMINYFY